MGTRLEFQNVLEGLLGSESVYFQPPTSVTMTYPAIVYNRDYRAVQYADNQAYRGTTRWQVTVIDRNPDSLIPDKVGNLQMSTYVRHFVVDQLNHDIYDVYF